MLVAFESCVSLMSVQLTDLELIKMVAVVRCSGVKFCPGGQLLASLQGHSAKVRV
jgi:hypothetical protein